MRWLYHLVRAADDVGDPYAPPSLASEGFVHCSFLAAVADSARLYFSAGEPPRVLQIDPRRLVARVEVADTPRGPMPHVHGPIARAAITQTRSLDTLDDAPDLL